jgi:WD40 repeat protein
VVAILLAATATTSLLWRAAESSKAAAMREIGLQLQETGREALLNGDTARALPFLLGALQHGIDTVALRLMLADATYVPALAIEATAEIKHAEFNSDGTEFVTADDQPRAIVWDAATGRSVFQPQAAAAWAAFDPTGPRLVTTNAFPDGRARTGTEGFSVWDTSAKKLLVGPVRLDNSDLFPSFSKDGAFITLMTELGLPHKWSASSGASVAPIFHALGGYEIVPSGGSRLFSPLEGFNPSSSLAMHFKSPETGWKARLGGSAPTKPDQEFRVQETAWQATLGGSAPTKQDQEFRVLFALDNTRAITMSWRTARVWDASNGEPLGPPVFHDGPVTAVDLSSDGRRLVTASTDMTARVWDVATGVPLTPPLVHDAPLTGAVFSPAADRLVTQSKNGLLYEWNASNGAKIATLGFGSEAAYSPDGSRIVARSSDTTITIFDAATGVAVPEGPVDSRKIGSYAFSPGSREILTTGLEVLTTKGDHARVWDAATGLPLTPSIEPMQSISFSNDGASLLTIDSRKARVWSLSGRRVPLVDVARGEQITLAAFSADGAYIVTANGDRMARVWNTGSGAPTTPPLEHRTDVCGVTFNRNGTMVLTVSRDNVARLWDATTGQQIAPALNGWMGCPVSQESFDTDGRFVVGATNVGARLWDARTGRVIRDYPVEALDSASISPDGTRIVTTTWFTAGGRWARLWETSTAKPLAAPMEDGIVARFSRDSKKLAVAGTESARVWNARNGAAVSPVIPATNVEALAFNSTGSRLVIGGNDSTALVWDADAGTPLSPPLEHPRFVTKVSFSDDDSVVVTFSEDEATRVWDAETGKMLRPVLRYGSSNEYDYAANGTLIAVRAKDALSVLSYPVDRRSLTELLALGRCAPFVLVNSTIVNIARGRATPTCARHDATTLLRRLRGKCPLPAPVAPAAQTSPSHRRKPGSRLLRHRLLRR